MNRLTTEMPAAGYEPALRHDDPLYGSVHHFYIEEAAILDAHEWQRWLSLLDDEISYVMPVRVSAMRDNQRELDMAHYDEDLYSMTKRVERLQSTKAWTEDPPSRTRHLVTNIRVFGADADGDVRAESSVLLFRSRGDDRAPEIVCARRIDRLRPRSSGFSIVARFIEVDESVLRTQNLAIFL